MTPVAAVSKGAAGAASADPATARSIRESQRRVAAWPYEQLDVTQLRASGWRPRPFHDFVFKIHQRCNLACDYCYVYESQDQSWRDRPSAMPEPVWRAAIRRLARHVELYELTSVRVILHGGEPLLFGLSRLERLVTELRESIPDSCAVEVGMQTNGVLLHPAMVESLLRLRVSVGVSVDGTEADHDRHRVDRAGRGSFAAVRKGLDLLRQPQNRASYAGIICTIAPETDPVACYEQLLAFDPPLVDFLIPHANWQHPPSRPPGSATPYADWLIAVFDRWYVEENPIGIRIFDDIITLLLGGASRSEQVGLSPAAILVVESDGEIEQVDALKSAYPGACATGLNVLRDDFHLALEDKGVIARQIGRAALSEVCLECPIHQICGAGHYAHRYQPGNGFRNPTVYCDDMRRLINYVWSRVAADVPRPLAQGAQ